MSHLGNDVLSILRAVELELLRNISQTDPAVTQGNTLDA